MKFAFFGTDEFSVAIIEKLISDFYYPEVIVSVPDKPVGRKQVMTPPAIKDVADHHAIELLQPEKVTQIQDQLASMDLDLIIVASYGKIIPDAILALPKKGSVNVHTSLLPAYRGASPIQAAVRDGLKKTGITIMMMDAEMDHGDIIFQQPVAIAERETYRSLHSKLAHVGADTLTKVLPDFLKGKMKPKPQDHELATFTKILKKEDAKIDWNTTNQQVDQLIRSAYDWPIAWTFLPDGKRLKVISAQPGEPETTDSPGTIAFTKDKVTVSCKTGTVELSLVQVEGKKEMTAKEFSAGYHRFDKQILGLQ